MKKHITSVIALVFLIVLHVMVVSGSLERNGGSIVSVSIGNSNWRAAIKRNGTVELVSDEYGQTAHALSFQNINKMIGKRYDHIKLKHSFLLESNNMVERNGRPYYVEEVNGIVNEISTDDAYLKILQNVKQTCEEYLLENITSIVMSVPEFFSPDQRNVIRDAALKIGLKIEGFRRESIMISIAYSEMYPNIFERDEMNILVIDMGKRSFDVTLLNYDLGIYEVFSSYSDNELGGEYFDRIVLRLIVTEIEKSKPELAHKLLQNKSSVDVLMNQAEMAKIALSSQERYHVKIPAHLLNGKETVIIELTRQMFEENLKKDIEKVLKPIKLVLNDTAMYFNSDVQEIIFSGGSTMIPIIKRSIIELLNGKEPLSGMNHGESGVIGTAIQTFKMFEEPPMVFFSPEILDLSLGIENSDGQLVKIVHRGTITPTMKNFTFSALSDSQDSALIRIYQGEFIKEAARNRYLGEICLKDVEISQIQLTFTIDANKSLIVSAMNLKSGINKEIIFTEKQMTIDPEKVEKMVIDAYGEEDVEVRNLIRDCGESITPANNHDEL